jgi:predicted RNA-binding protein with RPS1 domain
MRVALVEIADKFVNKITTYVQEGQSVKPAQSSRSLSGAVRWIL